jgi:hypothetical protein
MAQHIEQEVHRPADRRSTRARDVYKQLPASAANDNDREGPWPLVPLPQGPAPVPDRDWLSMEGIGSALLCEGASLPQPAQEDFPSSWRETLGRLAYVAAISVAMSGWLYFLWLALAYSFGAIHG